MGCGIVMSRKGGENKKTSLDVVVLLCLSFLLQAKKMCVNNQDSIRLQ